MLITTNRIILYIDFKHDSKINKQIFMLLSYFFNEVVMKNYGNFSRKLTTEKI